MQGPLLLFNLGGGPLGEGEVCVRSQPAPGHQRGAAGKSHPRSCFPPQLGEGWRPMRERDSLTGKFQRIHLYPGLVLNKIWAE